MKRDSSSSSSSSSSSTSPRSCLRRCPLPPPLEEMIPELSAEVAHYLGDVLRLTHGDSFIGFDGQGFERIYRLEVLESKLNGGSKRDRSLIYRAQSLSAISQGMSGAPLALCFAIPKGDKLERVARQITELGVSELHLWSAQRSVGIWKAAKVETKLERLQRVCREASRQSGRADELLIQPPASLSTLITRHAQVPHRLYFDLEGQPTWPDFRPRLSAHHSSDLSSEPLLQCVLLVGPEGGISPEERVQLCEAGWRSIRLNTPILRTETAGVVVCALALDRIEVSQVMEPKGLEALETPALD